MASCLQWGPVSVAAQTRKILPAILLIFACGTGTAQRKDSSLTFVISNRLGVETTVTQIRIDCPNALLSEYVFNGYQHSFRLQLDAKVWLLINAERVKQVEAIADHHRVTLNDGTTYQGALLGRIDGKEGTYDLKTTTGIAVSWVPGDFDRSVEHDARLRRPQERKWNLQIPAR